MGPTEDAIWELVGLAFALALFGPPLLLLGLFVKAVAPTALRVVGIALFLIAKGCVCVLRRGWRSYQAHKARADNPPSLVRINGFTATDFVLVTPASGTATQDPEKGAP